MYRTVAHQADIAIGVEADSLEGLFQESLAALIDLLTNGEAANVSGEELETFMIEADGFDNEVLLVGLLSELLFASQTLKWGPRKIVSVNLVPNARVSAIISGLPDGGGERLCREIKAVTYHYLKITHFDLWRVSIVFDV